MVVPAFNSSMKEELEDIIPKNKGGWGDRKKTKCSHSRNVRLPVRNKALPTFSSSPSPGSRVWHQPKHWTLLEQYALLGHSPLLTPTCPEQKASLIFWEPGWCAVTKAALAPHTAVLDLWSGFSLDFPYCNFVRAFVRSSATLRIALITFPGIYSINTSG